MEIEYAQLEGNSKKFYALMIVLFGVAGAGLLATYLFYAQGLHLTGMSNRVPWGISIVMAIYYIGLSAGSLVLSAMSSVFGRKEFKTFARIAALLTTATWRAILISSAPSACRSCHPHTTFNPAETSTISPQTSPTTGGVGYHDGTGASSGARIAAHPAPRRRASTTRPAAIRPATPNDEILVFPYFV